MTEITTDSLDRFLVGYKIDLEVEWSCRFDILQSTILDKTSRVYSKEQQMSFYPSDITKEIVYGRMSIIVTLQ